MNAALTQLFPELGWIKFSADERARPAWKPINDEL
jgi:hypothetical protein